MLAAALKLIVVLRAASAACPDASPSSPELSELGGCDSNLCDKLLPQVIARAPADHAVANSMEAASRQCVEPSHGITGWERWCCAWCSFQTVNTTDPDVVKLAAAAAQSYKRSCPRSHSCKRLGSSLQLSGAPVVTSARSQAGAAARSDCSQDQSHAADTAALCWGT